MLLRVLAAGTVVATIFCLSPVRPSGEVVPAALAEHVGAEIAAAALRPGFATEVAQDLVRRELAKGGTALLRPRRTSTDSQR